MRLWTLHPRYLDARGLVAVWREALLARARGYTFDRCKIGPVRRVHLIAATNAQVAHEWRHLMRKLSVRNPGLHRQWRNVRVPQCHPLFRSVRGPVEHWERRAARQ